MTEVPFRITVLDPPRGVTFALQRGRDELVPPSSTDAKSITFDFTVRVERGATLRFLGPFVQGPPAARFVYVSSGKRAGQTDTCWDRRAKISLMSITPALIDKASSGGIVETQIAGTGSDGGPACATVPLIDGWRVAPM